MKGAKFEPELLLDAVKALNKSLGIPEHLSEVGVTDDRIELMAEDAMKSGNILVNPRSTTKQDIISLYKRSL
jgi:alcohol dehydrogenase